MFISSDMRERARFIDQTAETVRKDMQDNPSLAHNLGGPVVNSLNVFLDNLQPVNVRHGEVRLPRRSSEEAVAIVAIRPGEELHLDPGTFGKQTAAQRTATRKQVKGWAKPDTPERVIDSTMQLIESGVALSAVHEPAPIKFGPNSLARVTAQGIDVNLAASLGAQHNLGESTRRIALGRPIVALLCDRQKNLVPEVAIAHEWFHNLSATTKPLSSVESRDDDELREELKARAVGAVYEVALYDDGDTRFRSGVAPMTNLQTDVLRRENIEDENDPYKPTDLLRLEFAADDASL